MNSKKLALAGAAAVAVVGFGAASASAATTGGQETGRRAASFTIEQVAAPAAHTTIQGPDFMACCNFWSC